MAVGCVEVSEYFCGRRPREPPGHLASIILTTGQDSQHSKCKFERTGGNGDGVHVKHIRNPGGCQRGKAQHQEEDRGTYWPRASHVLNRKLMQTIKAAVNLLVVFFFPTFPLH